MKKSTIIFIGTLGGALIGNSIFGLNQIVNYVSINISPQLANLLPLIGLIAGGVLGFYVARSS